uniref:Secreted protein n=1 Tax=Oryza brachyantha TaxID=4533 RepID=J3LGG7_ORYBR
MTGGLGVIVVVVEVVSFVTSVSSSSPSSPSPSTEKCELPLRVRTGGFINEGVSSGTGSESTG